MNGKPANFERTFEEQEIRDRAVRLFTYLRELTGLRSKTIRTCDEYEKVLWFNDIPQEPGCHCIAWDSSRDESESEVWLEIKKPRLKSPPQIPDPLKPWLDQQEAQNSFQESPVLRQRIIEDSHSEEGDDGKIDPGTTFRELAESPEIRDLWERYVEAKWRPWAEEDRRLQAVQRAYTDLFSIYQKQQRLGEAYEVVFGLGYLTWKTTNGHEIKRHLIVAQTSLTFDAPGGLIGFGPAGEGAKPALEQDMLDPQERPDAKEQAAIERQVTGIDDALWDGDQLQEALKAWVHAVSPRGQFDATLIPQKEAGPDPRVHLAPAVILRKRSERSLVQVFQEIVEQLRGGLPVPMGVRRLVTIVDDAIPTEESTTPPGAPSLPVEEIYFPLPANEKQLEIAGRLSTRQGVLVQGPPGTGKSHTIVNLVCHLLAMGQRVLVTSHTARALKVLRDKFPKEIADLCVILLGDDLKAMQALEDSVGGITGHYHTWDESRNRQDIANLEKRLDEARRAQATTLNELHRIREADTYRLRFLTYEGTTQAIAKRLKEEEPFYSWLSVRPEGEQEPPLSDLEAAELLALLRRIDPSQETELAKEMADAKSLLGPSEFVKLVREEAEAQTHWYEAAADRSHPSYDILRCASHAQRNMLIERLSDLQSTYQALRSYPQPWIGKAALQILSGQDHAWRDILSVTKEQLGAIGDRARRVCQRQISGLGERNRSTVKNHALALLSHLERGGTLGFGLFRPKVVKEGIYLLKQVRVDGHLCNRPQHLRSLLEWIETAERLNILRRHWSSHVRFPSASFTEQVAECRNLCEILEKALDLHGKAATVKEIIAMIPGLQEPIWHDLKDLESLHEAAQAAALEEEFDNARNRFDALEGLLRVVAINHRAHPVVKEMLEAVQARDEWGYGKSYQVLCDLQKSREALECRNALFRRLEAGSLDLAHQLASGFTDQVWDDRMARFTAAWNWARTDRWLRRLNEKQSQEQLLAELQGHRRRIQDLIHDLAAAKAWGHCLSNLSEPERQHLMAWTMAIRRIGKGKGKYVSEHREAAREHMEACRSAIPAWIMPIYRVVETLRPGTDRFDVVIVDEASQSGPEALFLLYLAKKIVVVGDDKQISPDFVGLTPVIVNLLRQRYISDIPHSDALGIEHSFFEQAEIRYKGRIRLREHFRCMPEIIQFSNNLCYSSEPLIPLRQYGANRLAPVVTQHVLDGYQKGHSPRIVNPPEAEAIVRQIEKCCKDPAYDEKTMGVISLLGEDQAKWIERLLLEKVGPEEMEKRHLVCGDAYAFQGDERDVMFLSLVSAPTEGQRIGTLASPRDERRFNVAASRARDQMWLFHTATLNDLSPVCVRYRLLQYCQNPHVEPTALRGFDLKEIRCAARTTDRERVKPPSPFDSWFEVDVFLMIAERGYRVIPQFEVAGYPIDLVVEGIRGRLAVECDGDTWHGVDHYEYDMARQRMLERCGWTFWRVRGSVFYRDPVTAIEGLWATLDRHGIYPIARQESLHMAHSGDASSPEAIGQKETRDRGQGSNGSEGSGAPPISTMNGPHREKTPEQEADSVADKDRGSPLLTPYEKWAPRPLPDPRSVPIQEAIDALVEIIGVEGPMLCLRAYRIHGKAAGIQRVGRQIRSLLDKAVRKAVRDGLIEESDEHQSRRQMDRIVRKSGTPAMRLRTRGDRNFDEIPPAEIGALMNSLLKLETPLFDDEFSDERLFQSVLSCLGLRRMTANIRNRLLQMKSRYVVQRS